MNRNKWIKVISFTYPHEAHLAKSKLESEGVETQIRDELTAQVNNFYSTAIGGVKIFVKEEDFAEALKILVRAGYISKAELIEANQTEEIEKRLSRSKFIYFIAIILGLISLIILLYSILSVPSKAERLSSAKWCVEAMFYEDCKLIPKTFSSEKNFVIIQKECWESLDFYPDGVVLLPGFQSKRIVARWKMDKGVLYIIPKNGDMSLVSEDKTKIIEGEEPTENYYYGSYDIKFDGLMLILESEKRLIYAKRKSGKLYF